MGRLGTVSWRRATEADLAESLEIQPRAMGAEIVGGDVAREVWKHLLGHPEVITAVFECDTSISPGRASHAKNTPANGLNGKPRGKPRIIGFASSVFVTRKFADAQIADPSPLLNGRIIASVYQSATGGARSILLTEREIARANAGEGLDVVTLCGYWVHPLQSPEQEEIQMALPAAFAQLHAGYKVRRVFGIAEGDVSIAVMRKSGMVQELGTFPEWNRVFNVMTSREAMGQYGSVAGPLFAYRTPVLGLSRAERELLVAAAEGAIDADIATALGVTLSAVKARWRSIFARFAKIGAELVPAAGDHNIRGEQKRHGVLAYVRQHPEELRPFEQ